MTGRAYAQLFKDQASKYVQFRPDYPPELFKAIYDVAQLPAYELSVDIATGQGQAAAHLADTFSNVIAIDATEEQLQFAAQKPNIEYRVADAHSTGLADSSVDLVTVAQAMHWFKLDVFYREVARILKPTGCLAAWGYDLETFPSFPEATKALHQLSHITLGPYWADKRKLIDRHYHGDEPSNELFLEVKHMPLMHAKRTTTINNLVGYITSWSSYTTFCKQHPDKGPELLQAFATELQRAFGTDDKDAEVEASMPLFMIIARIPVKAQA